MDRFIPAYFASSTDVPRWRLSEAILLIIDRYRFWLFGLLIIAYLGMFNGQWQIEPDSAKYLAIGRNLALGRGYTYQGSPATPIFPGFPLALAAIFRLAGSHALFWADVFLLLCGLTALAFTYRLIHLAYDRPTAVIVTLMLGINHEFFRYCYEIMTDVPFVMGVMAFLAGYEAIVHHRRRGGRMIWDWVFLSAGLVIAITTRPPMIGLLAIAIGATLFSAVTGRISRWVTAASVLILCAILAGFLFLAPSSTTALSNPASYLGWARSALTTDLPARLHKEIPANLKDLFGLSLARAVFGIPLWYFNWLFGPLALLAGLALFSNRKVWGLWIALTTLMLIVLISHDRYTVQMMPLLVLGWWTAIRKLNLAMKSVWGNILHGLLVLLFVGPNLAEVRYLTFTQHRQPFLAYYREGRYKPYVEMAQHLTQDTRPDDLITCSTKFSTILSFLSDRKVIEQDQWESLRYPQGIYVVFDPDDPAMKQWLDSQQMGFEGPPIEEIPREKGSPLRLYRALPR